MADDRPLLMIPGPVEVSPAVRAAAAAPPSGHTSPRLIESFGTSLARMREVWAAAPASQPFVVAGAGTLAMDMAAANLIEPGDRVLLLDTGYFSARMGDILLRLGTDVTVVPAPVGGAPGVHEVAEILARRPSSRPFKALFATHVDTSTGVRIDAAPLARLARDHDLLAVFDGVCAAAGERFEMADWDADVYFTASQKALGLPPGLALMVASERALAARAARKTPPVLYLDWDSWRPIMRSYEERRASYFSTPATSLILALEVGLGEILDGGENGSASGGAAGGSRAPAGSGLARRLALHERAAAALRAAWSVLGLSEVPAAPALAAHTLSALRYPPGIDASLISRIQAHGVTVAGGLHPAIRDSYFRVGHMGWVVTQPPLLLRTVEAIALALRDAGHPADPAAALAAARAALESGEEAARANPLVPAPTS
jgi:alanine-glyoxylate transaminase/serine-glyoxylate transaminase/serine-pyruvate transaminase